MIDDSSFAFGRVVDVNDPDKIGRVKIRLSGIHNIQVIDDDIPWSHCISSIMSASNQGIGSTPTGMDVGNVVFGILHDDEQEFIVLGTYHGVGDVNGLAIGIKNDESDNKTNIQSGFEEKTDYSKVVYPKNKVIQTTTGHIIEVDDTPGLERINVMHKTGSYIDIMPDGSIQVHSVKDIRYVSDNDLSGLVSGGYDVDVKKNSKTTVAGNDTMNISGDASLIVDGKNNQTIKGDETITIGGKSTRTITGDETVTTGGNLKIIAAGNIDIIAGGLVNIKGVKVNLN